MTSCEHGVKCTKRCNGMRAAQIGELVEEVAGAAVLA